MAKITKSHPPQAKKNGEKKENEREGSKKKREMEGSPIF